MNTKSFFSKKSFRDDYNLHATTAYIAIVGFVNFFQMDHFLSSVEWNLRWFSRLSFRYFWRWHFIDGKSEQFKWNDMEWPNGFQDVEKLEASPPSVFLQVFGSWLVASIFLSFNGNENPNWQILVGGLEHDFLFSDILGIIIPIDSYCSEGLKVNHQPDHYIIHIPYISP